jgi:hypothetical protein
MGLVADAAVYMMSNNAAFISDIAAGGSKAYVPALQQAIAKVAAGETNGTWALRGQAH